MTCFHKPDTPGVGVGGRGTAEKLIRLLEYLVPMCELHEITYDERASPIYPVIRSIAINVRADSLSLTPPTNAESVSGWVPFMDFGGQSSHFGKLLTRTSARMLGDYILMLVNQRIWQHWWLSDSISS